MKLTLEQVRDFLQAALDVSNDVLEAKSSLKDLRAQAEKARAEAAGLLKTSEGQMQEAKATEARAAKVLANAEARAKETDAKAEEKYQRVVAEASGMKAKAQQYVDKANADLQQIRDDIMRGQDELILLKADLEKARQSIRELLVRA